MSPDLITQLLEMKPSNHAGDEPEKETPPTEPAGEYDCKTCGAKFEEPATLVDHIRAEHSKKAAAKPSKPTGLEPEPKGKPQKKKQCFSYDEVIHHTAMATLFRVNNNQFWLPKSKYWLDSEHPKHVCVPDWFEINLKKYVEKKR